MPSAQPRGGPTWNWETGANGFLDGMTTGRPRCPAESARSRPASARFHRLINRSSSPSSVSFPRPAGATEGLGEPRDGGRPADQVRAVGFVAGARPGGARDGRKGAAARLSAARGRIASIRLRARSFALQLDSLARPAGRAARDTGFAGRIGRLVESLRRMSHNTAVG